MAKRKGIIIKTADELGEALGLSPADSIEMEFRSELTITLVRILQKGLLTHAQVAKRAGTSRTRVTAIANGNTKGISTDVLICVLAAAGYRAKVHVSKLAA
jgi:predicted XRE-type DNA-binding protein